MGKKTSFVRIVSQLLSDDIPIEKAVEAASHSSMLSRRDAEAASHVLSSLREGNSLSTALRIYPELFPSHYMLLITAAEQTGSLVSAMEFINAEEERRSECRQIVKSASIYPLVVIVFVILGTLLLFAFGGQYVTALVPADSLEVYRHDAIVGVEVAGLMLACYLFVFAVITRHIIGNSVRDDMCRNLAYMTKAGYRINQAVSLTLPSLPLGSKESEALMKIVYRLREGVDVVKAFSESLLFEPEHIIQLELAEIHGSCAEAFERIERQVERTVTKRRETFQHLVEPLLLTGVACYVLMILQSVVMPLLTQFGGMNV